VGGPQDGQPMLLLCGGFAQMIHWPQEVLSGLVARGFRVARFDNRDSGRSTHCKTSYTLEDMADDAVAVLDALGWSSAHVMGPSLGGMIGQVMAVRHPERVRSLTSMSSAPAWGIRFSKPKLRIALKAVALNAKGGKGRDAGVTAVRRVALLPQASPEGPQVGIELVDAV